MAEFGQVAEETVTTIRVINVPSHTTDTEFNCWFLFAAGFEQGTLVPTRGPDQSQLGWARFATVETAQHAIDMLNGRPLTEDQSPLGTVLAADFARSNYRPNPNTKKRPLAMTVPGMPPAATPQYVPMPQKPMPPPQGAPQSGGRIGTLFLGGLPDGVCEQEMNMFFSGHCEGFERLKFANAGDGRAGMAWAKFVSPDYAEAALTTIMQGVSLPSCPEFQLRGEFARNDLDKTPGGPGMHPQHATRNPQYATPQYAAPQQHAPAAVENGSAGCDTMFVGCLPPTVTEEELSGALMTVPGFVRSKLVGQGEPRPVAFVLFDSGENCLAAVSALHGAALPSAPEQAITCEPAKNSLDKRQRFG